MAVETLTYIYTSQGEIERLLSEDFADLMLDDLRDEGIDDAFTDAIEDATDFMNQYLLQIYLDSDLETSRWVHSRCTWLGAYYLSQRRGNPPTAILEQRKEEIEQELIKVQEGKVQIPRLPTNGNLEPGMSNYRVDDRFETNKTRVQPTISTGGTYGEQDLDPKYTSYVDGF